MSYSTNDNSNPLNGNGSFAVGGVGGAIVMGQGGLTTQMILGMKNNGAIMGDTSGPNAVNPSGTSSGIKHAQQNNFKNTRK